MPPQLGWLPWLLRGSWKKLGWPCRMGIGSSRSTICMNKTSQDTTTISWRWPVRRLYRHVSEIESRTERLPRMCSKSFRRVICRIFLERWWDTFRQSIKTNAAKLGLAKFCHNSLWGIKQSGTIGRTQKLLQCPWTVQFSSHARVQGTNLAFASEDVVWLSWKLSGKERVPNLRHTNESIRAYVTAGAWIHLYGYHDLLGENAKYCDTDSVIYIRPRNEPRPIANGKNLGYLQSELKSSLQHSWICKWGAQKLGVQGNL